MLSTFLTRTRGPSPVSEVVAANGLARMKLRLSSDWLNLLLAVAWYSCWRRVLQKAKEGIIMYVELPIDYLEEVFMRVSVRDFQMSGGGGVEGITHTALGF